MAVIQPPPYQSAQGTQQWAEWYRIINEKLSNISISIDGIDDITITSPADNEVLAYDSTSSKWINQTRAEASIQTQGDVLDDLNTVGAVSADSEFLVGTGAGVFAWESGDTVRTSLGLVAGGAGDIWVEKAGDEMTGTLGVSSGNASGFLADLSVLQTTTRGVTFVSNDSDGVVYEPSLFFFRRSSTPADGDNLGQITFYGKNNFGQDKPFITLAIESPSIATTMGRLRIITGGSSRGRYIIEDSGHYWEGKGDAATTMYLTEDYRNATATLLLTDHMESSSAGPILNLYRSTATPADNDFTGIIQFQGDDSVGGSQTTFAAIGSQLLDITNSTEDGILYLSTIVAGTLATRIKIGAGLYTNAATGGDKGADTINASAVYDDGAGPLTDFVLDHYVDGKIDYAWYDAAPYGGTRARQWNPMDLYIDDFIQRTLERRALPAFKTKHDAQEGIGYMVRAAQETLEVYAVHLDKLNKRITDLEMR